MSTSSPFIVTIDGPAGVGKSTLARRLAAALGIAYLDTGAMFRTLALHMARKGYEAGGDTPEDGNALRDLLAACVFSLRGTGAATELLCNGEPVGEAIRSEEAGMMAARIAVLPLVREYLKKAQRHLGAAFSLVAEGRDMGTEVFPSASRKFFLEADPEIRAERRCLQLREMGRECRLEELAEQIRQRDEQDRNRAEAPLRPAEDAVIIDTSRLDIDSVFAAMLREAGPLPCEQPPARAIRRKDRVMTRAESEALLERGEYGVLALTDKDGWPYGVPLSYVLMDGALYFHCAYEGRKIEAMAWNSRVCFTVTGETRPVYVNDFSTYYESVMVMGQAGLVEEEEEKRRSLRCLAEKYLPEHSDKIEENIARSFSRTAVYKISLDRVTGKAKRPKVPQTGKREQA